MALKMFIYTFQSHLFNSTISRFYISELKHQSFESEEDDKEKAKYKRLLNPQDLRYPR